MIRETPPDALSIATLRWLEELTTQGVFTTDRELKVRSWNRWLELQTGRPAAEVLGRHLFSEFRELVERRLDAHYRAALSGEARVLAHSFHRYFLAGPAGSPDPAQTARIAPLEADGAIIGTVTLIEDVSERLARERELRHQIETAEFARAMAEEAVRTKDEFLATLSHEIRTPLNAVVGWTRILQTRETDPGLLKRALDVIDRNATAQMHLIDDMLDMARIMAGKLRIELQPVDLRDVVLAAIDVIGPTARARGLKVETTLEPGEHRIAGDADRLQQVVWNLLSNAVKFTEPGGEVRIGLARDPEGIRIRVSDTGAGISEEFMQQMFERFRQAHASSSRRQGGLGLGLPLVKHLVELHGGTVRATSVVGAGSTFTVILPVMHGVALPEVQAADEPVDDSLANVRVLVVEDHDDARELTVTTLRRYGAAVDEAASCTTALSALDAALASAAPFHAIIADIGLPGEDGYRLMEHIRQRPPSRGGQIPVIAVTAYALTRDRQRALAAGFREHLVKPVSPGQLASTLRQVLTSDRRGRSRS